MKASKLRLVFIVIATAVSLSVSAFAQNAEKRAGPAENILVNDSASDGQEMNDRYRIGPGDILEIRVFNRPQLSREAIRVDGRGMIRIPLIDNEIHAACRTENELARDLDTYYREFLRNPHVEVFVRDYQSQSVAVLGAVMTPGRFQLQRRVRLLELLGFAGGPAERAGDRIQIIHTAGVLTCDGSAGEVANDDSLENFDSYDLNEALKGDDKSNPYVRPGDIITLPESQRAFVVGNVFKPSTIPLKEPVTVSQAIAMAGGIMPDTKSDKVRIIRQMSGNGKKEIFVDLKAVDKHRTEDIVLQANDIVDVPTSGGKRFLSTLMGAIAPTISRMPARRIP